MFVSRQPTPLVDFATLAQTSVSTIFLLAPESQRDQVSRDKQAAKWSKEKRGHCKGFLWGHWGFQKVRDAHGCEWTSDLPAVGEAGSSYRTLSPERHPLSETGGAVEGLTV